MIRTAPPSLSPPTQPSPVYFITCSLHVLGNRGLSQLYQGSTKCHHASGSSDELNMFTNTRNFISPLIGRLSATYTITFNMGTNQSSEKEERVTKVTEVANFDFRNDEKHESESSRLQKYDEWKSQEDPRHNFWRKEEV